MLAQGETDKDLLAVFDTLGTPEGATAAARLAKKAGATIVLGPVLSREVRPVLAVIGLQAPVITFSNDMALIDSGAFVFGITAQQSVTTILRFAASRGIRRIAIGGLDDSWGRQVRSAAMSIAREIGLESSELPAGALPTAPLPDAVLMSDAPTLGRAGVALKSAGVQLLGSCQGLDIPPEVLGVIEGAWLSSPDPVAFAGFARTFEDRTGSAPGLISGLAYDAVNIVKQLRLGGGVDRSAVLAGTNFKGVCGDVRFRDNGSIARALSVLAVTDGKLRTVAPGSLT